jgi:hypothetical protein
VACLVPVIVTAGPVYTVNSIGGAPEASNVKWARPGRDFTNKEEASDLTADLVSFAHLNEYAEEKLLAILSRYGRPSSPSGLGAANWMRSTV